MFDQIEALGEKLQIIVEANASGVRRRSIRERKVCVLHGMNRGVCSEKKSMSVNYLFKIK